ncbi:MAG: rcp1 2 [Ferruginibacter sp.]|nr:rcp1 2 [Ferruginibacter sp.]
MHGPELNILLADDDKDDCGFFAEALEELALHSQLTTVHDGEQLLQLLMKKTNELPHVLFLDLNMPLKNGFACLEEIRRNPELDVLPVIIWSTSFDTGIVDLLYRNGAQYYISKPAEYGKIKKVIQQALTLISTGNIFRTSKDKFLLSN